MGSRLTTVAVVVLATSLAAPAISAATQPEIGLGQAQPAAAPALGTIHAAPAATLQAPPAPTLRATATATASGASAVTIRDFSFNPNGVTVHAGDTVTWTNDGKVASGHRVTGKGFDSGVLHAGRSYSHIFSSPGTFSYICQIHPFMKGTVTVLASSSPAGSPSPQQSGTTGSSTTTPTPTGSGSSTTRSSGTASSGGSLPTTGSDLWLLALTGLELAAAGALLGRLLRS